jgi:hypothetical protein
MKDKRLVSIYWEKVLDSSVYVLLWLAFAFLLVPASMGEETGMALIGILIIMGGIRIRGELRKIRADAIRRENADRAERAGLAMPRLYEDVDDLTDALHKLNAKPPSAPKYNGGAKTTVCPTCAHCMAIPPDYSRNEAKCGSCGHVYKL